MPNLIPTIPQPKKKKPLPDYKTPALIGGGLIGAGLGMQGLKHLVLNDQDALAASRFSNAAKGWAEGGDIRNNLLEYVNEGSTALNATPLATDSTTLMAKARNPKFLGMLAKLPKFDKAKDYAMAPGAESHYQQFQKSPLDGYLEMNRELAGGNPAITHGYSKGTFQNLVDAIKSNTLRPSAGDSQIDKFIQFNGWPKDIENPAPQFQNSYRESVKRLMSDTQPGLNVPGLRTIPNQIDMGYYSKLKALTNDYANSKNINLSLADFNQKKELLGGLDGYIKNSDPNFWKQKQFGDFALGNTVPSAGKSYSMLTDGLLNTRRALHYGSIAAGAAGLGIGGYAIYKALKAHLQKKKAMQNNTNMLK